MSIRRIHDRDYELHEIAGMKLPFDSLSSASTLVNHLETCLKSLSLQVPKLEDQVAQYQRTNGHLMVEIDRLKIRITELERSPA